ncbi:MAG: peptidase C1 [Lachnospiraceae bacterium]|nr:peptidase C1 [Lachnospiraceae bacterium]
MKHAKPYIVCGIVVIFVLLLQLNTWSASYGSVEQFRGANLKEDIFYPLIAKSINDEKRLNVKLDGAPIVNEFDEVHVGRDKSILLSFDFVRDKLNLSTFYIDDDTARIMYNGTETKVDLISDNNIDYVKADDVCRITGYSSNADLEALTVDISTNGKSSKLPGSFDLRKYDRVSEAMNQGNASTCWAYASILALESAVLPRKAEYDVDAMIKFNGEVANNNNAGGAFTNALAYLLSWNGPINKNSSSILLSGNDVDEVKHVQEAKFYKHSDINDIKWAVYKYGGVSTSIFANISNSNLDNSNYYNAATNGYCYNGTNEPNHEITIIGWDDNYDASNFGVSVKGNGAFICQNSWGKGFGESGVFYVSYYDSNIGAQAVAYSRITEPDYYNNIYQCDLCGWKGQLGYGQSNALAANIYTAKSGELLRAVGLYAIDKGANVDVYLVRNYNGTESLKEREKVASRSFDTAGYYTIELDKPVELQSGEQFAIVIDIRIPNAQRPVAMEYKVSESDVNVKVDDGEGYISKDGMTWESVEDKANGNLCLKAYTSNVGE